MSKDHTLAINALNVIFKRIHDKIQTHGGDTELDQEVRQNLGQQRLELFHSIEVLESDQKKANRKVFDSRDVEKAGYV